jgi:hypothetical protein
MGDFIKKGAQAAQAVVDAAKAAAPMAFDTGKPTSAPTSGKPDLLRNISASDIGFEA